jgi:hypothetical protein
MLPTTGREEGKVARLTMNNTSSTGAPPVEEVERRLEM